MADRILYVENGITRTHVFEEDGDTIFIDEMPKQTVKSLIDANHEDRQNNTYNKKKHGGSMPFARVPITTHHEWVEEWKRTARMWGIPFSAFAEKKLQECPVFRL